MTGTPGAVAWTPYCGAAPDPAELFARWNLDPALLLAFAAAAVIWGWKASPGQAATPFAAGMAILLMLFVSPVCALTSALFAARTAHHALLMAVAAPLLALALPSSKPVRALPLWTWTAVQGAVLWAWHLPSLYSAALSRDAVYWIMQASLLGTSFAFWSRIRHAPVPAAVVALLATMVQMGLLGALITFASAPLYAPHLLTTAAWGLSPLDDQQLAGLIMWVPAAALYLLAALLLAGRWLRGEGPSTA